MMVVLMVSMVAAVFANGNSENQASSEMAAKSKPLIVYSPQGDEARGGWIMEKCKEQVGLDIQFLTATGGDIAERLMAEKLNPQADVVFGLVQTAMYQLKDENMFYSYVPDWASGLMDTYKDKDGYFHCFWQTPIVIGYNSEVMTAEQAPKDWIDLIKPEYKEKYILGGVGSQTVRTYVIGFLWNYLDKTTGEVSEEGWEALRVLFANTGAYPTGSSSYAAMKEGYAPIILNWFGGVKSKTEQMGIPVAYVTPANGTPVVSESIAIVKGSKNLEDAKKFVEWFGSPAFMAEYANHFGQAPVHPEAIALCNDSVKADAMMFTAQEIDWELASAHLNDWLEKIQLEIMP